jgi:hypothetical protein
MKLSQKRIPGTRNQIPDPLSLIVP